MAQWVEKHMCNEQHNHPRSLGLVHYINNGYPDSYHHMNILRHSNVYRAWCQYFTHRDDYFKYLLGDLGYMDEEMFIMHKIG